MKQKFTYYLHGKRDRDSWRDFFLYECDIELTEEAIKRVVQRQPFYEIALDCEVDEHGNVKINGIVDK